MKKLASLCAALLLLALLAAPSPADAHRLNVHAWLEGSQIVVESNFGRNHPARGAQIRVVDSDTGKVLIQGQTSDHGVFSFPVPSVVRDGHGLTVEVDAGQGHFNDWKMDASELYAAASLTAGFDQAAIDAAKEGQPGQAQQAPPAAPQIGAYQVPSHDSMAAGGAAPQAAQQAPAPASQNLPMPNAPSHEELRGIIEQAMANQLRSVHQAIAQQDSGGPSLVNVIGGLGWIVGVFGIYLYSRSRRESKNSNGD